MKTACKKYFELYREGWHNSNATKRILAVGLLGFYVVSTLLTIAFWLIPLMLVSNYVFWVGNLWILTSDETFYGEANNFIVCAAVVGSIAQYVLAGLFHSANFVEVLFTLATISVSMSLLVIPTYLIVHSMKKARNVETTPQPEVIEKKLRKGFFLSYWGFDMMILCLPIMVLGLILPFHAREREFGTIDALLINKFGLAILSIVVLIAGLILFFVGRLIVASQSTQINFIRGRSRTAEEELFLQEMVGEQYALGMRAAHYEDNMTHNVIFASGAFKTKGTSIGRYFAIAKNYTGGNLFFRHWPIIAGITMCALFTGRIFGLL